MPPIDARGPLLFVGSRTFPGPNSTVTAFLGDHGREVLVVPTGAAYERPDRAVEAARAHFGELGVVVRPCMVLSRRDAEESALAAEVGDASVIWLCGGSPLHLRSVLKDSNVLRALRKAWENGAAICGADAGAMALTDPMLDPRGGAFTVGLGLVRHLAVEAKYEGSETAQFRRTLALLPSDSALIALSEGAAVVRRGDGTWSDEGTATAVVFENGEVSGLEALAGKPID